MGLNEEYWIGDFVPDIDSRFGQSEDAGELF